MPFFVIRNNLIYTGKHFFFLEITELARQVDSKP